jgi:hypothetical protein
MTLLFVVLSIFPIIDVQNRASFTAKVSAAVVIPNLIGAFLYIRAQARRVRRGIITSPRPAARS